MGLFGNKIVSALTKAKKKEIPITARYRDGSFLHESKIIRVDKDRFLIQGFGEAIREDHLIIDIKELTISVATTVIGTTHDLRGTPIYHCSIPEKLQPIKKVEDQWYIYPKGRVDLLMEDAGRITELRMFVWSTNPTGLELLDTSNKTWEVGYKFLKSNLKISAYKAQLEMEVAYQSEKPYGKQVAKILGLKYCDPIDEQELYTKMCKKIDRS